MKPDILDAVHNFLVCKCDQDYVEGESNDSLKRFESFRFFRKSGNLSRMLAVVEKAPTSSDSLSGKNVAGSQCVSGALKAVQDLEHPIVEPSRQASSSHPILSCVLPGGGPNPELEQMHLHARHNDNGLDYELEEGDASKHSSRNGGLCNPPAEDDEETVHA
jgi:hypothetical protein